MASREHRMPNVLRQPVLRGLRLEDVPQAVRAPQPRCRRDSGPVATEELCGNAGMLKSAKLLKDLVDLVRFELTTSSMPFKKYQSLADNSTKNKRLSTKPRGRRWTPRGGSWASGLHPDSRTPHPELGTWRAFARGCKQFRFVVWSRQHLVSL